jgi:hypothetical protein
VLELDLCDRRVLGVLSAKYLLCAYCVRFAELSASHCKRLQKVVCLDLLGKEDLASCTDPLSFVE